MCASPRADPCAGTRGLGGSICSFFPFFGPVRLFRTGPKSSATATTHVTTIVRRRSKNKAEGCGAFIRIFCPDVWSALETSTPGGTRLYSKNPSPFQCALGRETRAASSASRWILPGPVVPACMRCKNFIFGKIKEKERCHGWRREDGRSFFFLIFSGFLCKILFGKCENGFPSLSRRIGMPH